ncbi:MAG: CBS domain-containing protein [Egibacteraceae bacterium]
MSPSVILVVDGDPAVGAAWERDVAVRYGPAQAVAHAGDAAAGMAACHDLAGRGQAVALLVAAEHLPDGAGMAFLTEAHHLHPDAGRVLLAEHADAESAVVAVNQTGLDRCLVTPWTDPEEELYPVLDDLLADWSSRVSVRPTLVSDVMQTAVATLDVDASLAEAAALVAATRVPDLMVVDAARAFVGVLSEGDILRSSLPDLDEILAAGGTLRAGYQLFLHKARALSDKPIARLIITEPFVLAPDDHVAKAATLLIDRQIRLLPVLDGTGLVGTLSRADICRAVVEAS